MDPRLDKFNALRDRPDPGARRLSSLIKIKMFFSPGIQTVEISHGNDIMTGVHRCGVWI